MFNIYHCFLIKEKCKNGYNKNRDNDFIFYKKGI